jgi:V/A-type H+-transporting ATPase subunit C
MSDRYLYENARATALQNTLLTKQQFSRLEEASSSAELVKALSDFGFGGDKTTVDGMAAFELEKAVGFLKGFNQTGDFDGYLLQYDYHNLKVLVKTPSPDPSALMPEGICSLALLKKGLTAPKELRPFMADTLLEIEELKASNKFSPRAVSQMLDKAMYKDILSSLRARDTLGKSYFTKKIDFTNLESLLRCQRLHLPLSYFEDGFIEGGTLSVEFFEKNFELPVEELAKANGIGDYKDAVLSAVEGGTQKFENYADRTLFSHFSKDKNDFFTYSPLMYFFSVKLNEIKNIRLASSAIVAGKKKDEIFSRMGETYGA